MVKGVPSIELVSDDARGQIYAVGLPDGSEMLLLHSVKGTLRGGHSHDVDEVVTVLSGEMNYHKLLGKNSSHIIHHLTAGQSSFNKAGEVHMGEFTEDTWLLERKLVATKGAWQNTDYAPWREKVLSHVGV